MVRKGQFVTPGVTSDILEGITRAGIIEIAQRELGLETLVRPIDRSELYVAEEVFLCGTGGQISAVASIDHRQIGDGGIGPITRQIMDVYFAAVKGQREDYRDWVLPVY